MTHIRTKLVVAGIVLVAALAYLATAGIQSGGWVYFMEVDQFVNGDQHNARVRLHGKVGDDGFSASSAAQIAQFELTGKAAKLAVVYHGSIPDQFAKGKNVVVEGTLKDGKFHADVLMTKCASKYEPNSPHASANGGAKQS